MLRPLFILSALLLTGCQPQEQKEWENHWNGVPILQFPSYLMLYQNLIYELHPDAIVETGTYFGGLTLYLATILEGLSDPAPILTVDLEPKRWNELVANIKSGKMKFNPALLKRITFIQGSSTAPEVLKQVDKLLAGKKKVMVLLDATHAMKHVLEEIRLYSKYIPVGGCLLVTDTHLDGTSYMENGEPGPRAAVQAFLAENKDFEIYKPSKQYMISAVHEGILKRVR